jgi:hypothetical protein
VGNADTKLKQDNTKDDLDRLNFLYKSFQYLESSSHSNHCNNLVNCMAHNVHETCKAATDLKEE